MVACGSAYRCVFDAEPHASKRLFLGVDLRPALAVERQHVVGFGVRSFHTRRSNGHAGDGQPCHRRLLLQQPVDLVGVYVSLNQIPINLAGVAPGERRWDAAFGLDPVELGVRYVSRIDGETIVL